MIKVHHNKKILVVMVLMVLLHAVSALCATYSSSNVYRNLLAKENNQSRLLQRFDNIPENITSDNISLATISIRFPVQMDTLSVWMCKLSPVSCDWNPETVSWNEPWSRGGGDYDTTKTSLWYGKPGKRNRITFDVTDIIRSRLLDRTPDNGLLLIPKKMNSTSRNPFFDRRIRLERISIEFKIHYDDARNGDL